MKPVCRKTILQNNVILSYLLTKINYYAQIKVNSFYNILHPQSHNKIEQKYNYQTDKSTTGVILSLVLFLSTHSIIIFMKISPWNRTGPYSLIWYANTPFVTKVNTDQKRSIPSIHRRIILSAHFPILFSNPSLKKSSL